MNEDIEALARLIAWKQKQAVRIRQTGSISADPERTFAVAVIRLVGEERLQAVACGVTSEAPLVVTTTNPLDRDASNLEPVAEALDQYITESLAVGVLPRVWVANPTTRECLTLLGPRYRYNRRASDKVQRLGWLCAALTNEAEFVGQQVLVEATTLLNMHLCTGQSPSEDAHLAALLAWVAPQPGTDARLEAVRRALVPAAAMLPRDLDDRVEQLRGRSKAATSGGEAVRQEITTILRQGVMREYALLLGAREAFWALGLAECPGTGTLVKLSFRRLARALTRNAGTPKRPDSLSELLVAREYAAALAESVWLGGDNLVREQARRQGRAFVATILDVWQPRPGRRPCNITIATSQRILRVRTDTELRARDGRLTLRVTSVSEELLPGTSTISLDVTKGYRSVPEPGDIVDLDDAVTFDSTYSARRTYRKMQELAPPLVYNDELPAPWPRTLPPADFLSLIDRYRKE